MSAETDGVPPVPQHTPPIDRREAAIERFENNWMQWFIAVRTKVNVINTLIVNLSKFTGNGFAVISSAQQWFTRSLVAGTAITISNNDGTAGNPTIGHADTSSISDLTSDNSNGVVIQDFAITFDSMGHVQTVSVATVDLDGRYVTKTNPSMGTLVNAVDDTAAAAGGVPVGGLYRNGSVLMIRVT